MPRLLAAGSAAATFDSQGPRRIPIYLHFLSIFQDNARFAFMWH
jgi:hypothetical protein